jgi:hypothetical protein
LSPQFVLAVAVGGAIGSVARYLVAIGSGKLFGINFPWGILIINVTGSFFDWCFCRLIRDQVGFTAVGSHFSDGRNLWGLHDLFDVLLGQLPFNGAWSASDGAGLHCWISSAVDLRSCRRTLSCSGLVPPTGLARWSCSGVPLQSRKLAVQAIGGQKPKWL